MNVNERIAEKMGWELVDGIYFGTTGIWNGVALIGENQDEFPISVSKLLQARMVEDGWEVHTISWKDTFGKIRFEAWATNDRRELASLNANSGEAALCALFCKVYNIPAG